MEPEDDQVRSGEKKIGFFSGPQLLLYFDAGWTIIDDRTGKKYTREKLVEDLKEAGAI